MDEQREKADRVSLLSRYGVPNGALDPISLPSDF